MTRVEVLLDENRTFHPPEEIVKQSNVKQWMDAHNIPNLESLYERGTHPTIKSWTILTNPSTTGSQTPDTTSYTTPSTATSVHPQRTRWPTYSNPNKAM